MPEKATEQPVPAPIAHVLAPAVWGAAGLTTDGTDLTIASASRLLWSTDLILRRSAAATLALGAVDAAAPVAQSVKVQNVVTGTSNTAGVDFTLNGSQGTGTGIGGKFIVNLAPAGSTGSTPNAQVASFTFSNVASTGPKILGDGASPSLTLSQSNGSTLAYGTVVLTAGGSSSGDQA